MIRIVFQIGKQEIDQNVCGKLFKTYHKHIKGKGEGSPYNRLLRPRGWVELYVVGSKSFRPDIQKPRQMENAVRDI